MAQRKFFAFVFLPMLVLVLLMLYGPHFFSAWAQTREDAVLKLIMFAYAPAALLQLLAMRKTFQRIANEEG